MRYAANFNGYVGIVSVREEASPRNLKERLSQPSRISTLVKVNRKDPLSMDFNTAKLTMSSSYSNAQVVFIPGRTDTEAPSCCR
jgi:hypothetical protein